MTLSLNATFRIFNAPVVDYKDSWEQLFESYLYHPGRMVVQQGKPADYLYFIISGSVEVSYKPYDGDLITLAHLEKGGWFGWSALVGSKYYTSSVIAIEPLEVLRVSGSDLRRFCLESPEAGKVVLCHLANSVSGRWMNAKDEVLSILTQGMRES